MRIKTDIRTQLLCLLEDGLREKVCKPLLNAIGAHAVEKYHSPGENGKDVYFAYRDLLGEHKHCCLFIKAGDVGKTGKNDIRKIKTSIEEALNSPFISPIENNSEVFIEEFYFVCNGKLNKFARNYLFNLFRSRNFPNFKVVDIDKLTDLIRRTISVYSVHVDNKYVFGVGNFNQLCLKIVSFKEQFESRKVGSNIFID